MSISTTQPRAPAIASELRRRVLTGHWKPKQRILTEHQLAREFGVSRGTVIRSLRELEREGLIWTRRGEGRFVSDLSARPRTGTIGTVVLDMSLLDTPLTSACLSGMRDVCGEVDYNLQIFAFNRAAQGAIRINGDAWMRQIDPARLDGLLLNHWGVPEEAAIELSRKLPIVWVMRPKLSDRIGGSTPDLAGGTMDATRHLLDLGHLDVLLVTIGEHTTQGWHQREGLRLGMRLCDHPKARRRVVCAKSNRNEEWLGEFADILRQGDRPTAVIFGSDDLALSGLSVIRQIGLKIPQDLSLVSTNDTLAPPQVPVAMTAIRWDFAELGRVSVRLLMDMISDPLAAHETQILPTKLVVRQSTGTPRNP